MYQERYISVPKKLSSFHGQTFPAITPKTSTSPGSFRRKRIVKSPLPLTTFSNCMGRACFGRETVTATLTTQACSLNGARAENRPGYSRTETPCGWCSSPAREEGPTISNQQHQASRQRVCVSRNTSVPCHPHHFNISLEIWNEYWVLEVKQNTESVLPKRTVCNIQVWYWHNSLEFFQDWL